MKEVNKKKYTRLQYQEAKKITNEYEKIIALKKQKKIKLFKVALQKYFDENLLSGEIKLKEFELEGENIIPINPYFEECYDGENDEDIEKICKKFKVNYSIVYWCYGK